MRVTAEQWAYMHTEDYALEKEKEEDLWHTAYGSKEQAYIDQINVLLSDSDNSAKERLQAMLKDTAFHEGYSCRTPFAYMYILLGIWEQEQAAGLKSTVFDRIDSVEDAISLVRRFRFFTWHIEFDDLEHSTGDSFGDTANEDKALLDYIARRRLSPIATGLLAVTCAVSPPKMLLHLSSCFLDSGDTGTACDLLDISNKLYPGNKTAKELLQQLKALVNNL